MPLYEPVVTDTTLVRARLNAMYDRYMALKDEASAQVKGCRVRILTNWRGDKRRSQKGKIYIARAAFFSDGWGVCLWLEDTRTSIYMSEVEFLDETPPSQDILERTRFDLLDESWDDRG